MKREQPRPSRVVIDPNVIISAAISSAGPTGHIIEPIDVGTLTPVVTEHLIGEVQDVVTRPRLAKYLDAAKATRAVAELARLGEWHADPVDPPQVCRDPGDDYLLALALAARADALVTGDRDLHAIDNPGVWVLTPRELLDRLER
ncbi:MAG: putative toxin-antitoxin system toxin component, PIN family [Micrococcales bacterium]|nr:putative toxin-antitoxin system toxin component, PIN family [Micrococcales bacterium]